MSLHALADAIRRRNLADADIARLIGRPAERGHIGEFIAAHVFDLQLEESAVAKGIDGRFRSGPLAGATVNVKMYGKLEYLLDIRPDGVPDYYLVLTGSGRAMATSRGGTRPLEIERVFLFAGPGLVQSLQGVKLGVACSVRKVHWAAAEIYPEQTSALLPLSEEQRKLLLLFHPAVVAPLRNAGASSTPRGATTAGRPAASSTLRRRSSSASPACSGALAT